MGSYLSPRFHQSRQSNKEASERCRSVNRQQGLPKDKTLLAGLAFSVFGLTDVFITLVILMERWTTLSTVQIGVVTCLLSVVVGCGFAAGSVRRRSLIGLALVLSWASLLYAEFYGGTFLFSEGLDC